MELETRCRVIGLRCCWLIDATVVGRNGSKFSDFINGCLIMTIIASWNRVMTSVLQ